MKRAILSCAVALIAGAATAPVLASDSTAASPGVVRPVQTVVVERTRLKANEGERDALAQFVVANWFEMDEVALRQGLFTSYRLLENPDPNGEWDWVVEVGYPNPGGYSNPEVQAKFQAIREAHETVLIDGKSLRELGRVVGSERLTVRAGSY